MPIRAGANRIAWCLDRRAAHRPDAGGRHGLSAVSLGGQKCFAEFALRLAQRPEHDQKPDRRYLEHLVAKASLFRHTDKVVARTFREKGLEGYKAQVVAYAVALISNRTSRRLDLDVIWRSQQLPEELRIEIPALARLLRSFFDRAPGNISEWAKKPACWEKARALPWKLSGATVARLTTKAPTHVVASNISIEDLLLVPWSELADWANEHNKLTAVDRRIASGTAALLSAGKTPTDKQIDNLRRIYDAALNNGFASTGNTDAQCWRVWGSGAAQFLRSAKGPRLACIDRLAIGSAYCSPEG